MQVYDGSAASPRKHAGGVRVVSDTLNILSAFLEYLLTLQNPSTLVYINPLYVFFFKIGNPKDLNVLNLPYVGNVSR